MGQFLSSSFVSHFANISEHKRRSRKAEIAQPKCGGGDGREARTRKLVQTNPNTMPTKIILNFCLICKCSRIT